MKLSRNVNTFKLDIKKLFFSELQKQNDDIFFYTTTIEWRICHINTRAWVPLSLCDGEWWESAHFRKTQWNSVSQCETRCGKVRQRQTNLTNSVFDSVSRFATMFDAARQCLILRDDIWFYLLYFLCVKNSKRCCPFILFSICSLILSSIHFCFP